MLAETNDQTCEAGGWQCIRTASEGGPRGWVGSSEQLFLQRARRVRLSEAKVCSVRGVLFWADYSPRVSVGAVLILTQLTKGSSQLWLLLRQPSVRKYLPFFLYLQWFNWTKHDCIKENCRHFTTCRPYSFCAVHVTHAYMLIMVLILPKYCKQA